MLTANRTYYVRTDGNDANTGLANTAGGAFLTVQKAIDVVAAIDLGPYSATIQIGPGTYNERLTLKTFLGAGPIIILGDETTPANVTLSSTGAATAIITADAAVGKYSIRGLKLTSTVAAQHGLYATNASVMEFQNVDFGALNGGWHILASDGSAIKATGNYEISGGADRHLAAVVVSSIRVESITVTLSGTPVFATAFAYASRNSAVRVAAVTYSGGAIGPRYAANANAVIDAAGAGATFFPATAPDRRQRARSIFDPRKR